jgi:hypothetical protein
MVDFSPILAEEEMNDKLMVLGCFLLRCSKIGFRCFASLEHLAEWPKLGKMEGFKQIAENGWSFWGDFRIYN